MKIAYKEFVSIEQIKAKGEFIKKGKIYPVRIIKAPKRRIQCRVRSGSNQWAFPTRSGYLIFVENNDGHFKCVVNINANNGTFTGSPYSKGGTGTRWQGNSTLNEDESLKEFNRIFLSMNNA